MPTSITPTTTPIKFITTSEANLNDINIVAGQIIYTTEGNIYYDQSNLRVDGNDYHTGFTGNGEPHNIMQPYLAVYIWERTA